MPTVYLPRQDWLAHRRKGVGASEAAAVLGLCPFKTPLEVWMDKRGLLPDRDPTPRQAWGLRLQAAIKDAYCEDTGRDAFNPPVICRHPQWPWMLASLDYWAHDRVVEIKRINQYAASEFGPSGTAEIPERYMLQVQQQMACADRPLADLAALIGHDDFRIYTIDRNDAVIEKLAKVEREFMDSVEAGDPPLPDFQHPTTCELLNLIEPDFGSRMVMDAEGLALAIEYDRLGKVASETEKLRKEVKARLMHAMGLSQFGELPDGRTIRRQTVERKGYTVEASSYVEFRILQPKGR